MVPLPPQKEDGGIVEDVVAVVVVVIVDVLDVELELVELDVVEVDVVVVVEVEDVVHELHVQFDIHSLTPPSRQGS